MKSRHRGFRWITCWAARTSGVLLLAATGCGGGSLNTPGFTPLPAPVLGTYTSSQSVAAAQGQSAVVESLLASGNVSNVTVVVPPGALLQSATLAVAPVPADTNTLERIKRATPELVTRLHSVVEVVFGQVTNTSTRAIVSATPILSTGASVSPTYQIKLSADGVTAVNTLLATPGVTSTFQVLVRDEFSFNNRLIQPEGATVTYDAAQALITVKGVRAYDLLVNVAQQ